MIEDVEIIILFPEKKPPFIGILFKDEKSAECTNKNWIDNYHKDLYQIVIEPIHSESKLLLYLIHHESKSTYHIKRFDFRKVRELIYKIKNLKTQTVNFGHVIYKNNKLTLVRSCVCRRNWVLKINRVDFWEECN